MITIRLAAWALTILGGLCAQATPPEDTVRTQDTVRTEHFLLELVDRDDAVLDAPGTQATPLGLALLRTRRAGDSTVLEWELRFREEGRPDTRVHHVESFDAGQRRVVWRELRPGSGRTLFVEDQPVDARAEQAGAELGALRSIEWGGEEGLRRALRAPAEAVFPLELIELARSGSVRAGEFELFSALERRFETVALSMRLDSAAGAGVLPATFGTRTGGLSEQARTLELHRPDGSLAGAYRFRGAQLEAFQWQAGSARGRRIPRAEWLRRLDRMEQADRTDA